VGRGAAHRSRASAADRSRASAADRSRARHSIYSPPLRGRRAIRATAWVLVATGIALPVLRRRLKIPPAVVLGGAGLAPAALCVAIPRSRARDAGVCVLNMWAYLAAYEMPNDDPDKLADRVLVDYPVAIDRVLGLGTAPTLRLQRTFSTPGRVNRFERVLVWCHWMWFFVPHATVAYVWWRDADRFPSAAARMYGVFDAGAVFYWAIPTAPPWYAAGRGRLEDGDALRVRRMMIEYGQQFWGERWGALYDVLGGNPLAAMPSLHFATSLMAAHLLSEIGPVSGAVGWIYAATLGLALVYLGEHYAVDLIGGAALAEGVRAAAPRSEPLYRRLSAGLQALELRAGT
jgi:membrane-associated phospholipid phosphatase